MTEEENKAIELIGWLNLNGSYIITSKQSNEQDVHKAIDTIVNLVKKQAKENKGLQKENEELKEKIFKRDKELIKLEEYANKNFERKDDVKAKYIPKDKIRELLKEHNIEFAEDTIAMSEQGAFGFMLSIKELLEEE